MEILLSILSFIGIFVSIILLYVGCEKLSEAFNEEPNKWEL